jgi:hypothetical protein
VVIEVKEASEIIGGCNVRVETFPYRNKMWFDDKYLSHKA